MRSLICFLVTDKGFLDICLQTLHIAKNYQKFSKSSLQKGNSGSQNSKTQEQTQQRKPDFLSEYVKSVTHTGFFLWSEDILQAKLCVLLPLMNLALLVHCVYMVAQLKITLCRAQSIKNPIAPCVNFGLRIPLKYHDTLGRQTKANLLLILYRLWQKQWCKLR